MQIKKENDLLIKELDFLKNQFNSHLTFNFLNHCYSRIYKKLPQTAESIELFSEVLRYTLQSKANNKVLIAEELTNIENFIQLQKKLKPGLIINFYCAGDFENKYVFPHIFIYFIKNVLNDDNDRFNFNTDIDISIDNNSILTFKVKSIDLFFQYDEIKNYLDYYYSNNYRLKEIRTDRISEIEFILSDLSK